MIVHGDMFVEVPARVQNESADLIIFDPPYGIGDNKLSLKSKKWKKSDEEWDQFTSVDDQYEFYKKALSILLPTLKSTGSIFIFGSYHNIHLCGELLQRHFKSQMLNSIVWNKINAMFNITQSRLIEGTEHIIWASGQNSKPYFNYEYAYSINSKQLRNVWSFPQTPTKERMGHPHQKSIEIVNRLIRIACPPKGFVLDPMSGSGTTEVVASYLGLDSLCIERNAEFYKSSLKRLDANEDIFQTT